MKEIRIHSSKNFNQGTEHKFPLRFADEGLLQAPRDGDRGAAPGHRRGAEVPQDGGGVHGLLRRRRTHAQVFN